MTPTAIPGEAARLATRQAEVEQVRVEVEVEVAVAVAVGTEASMGAMAVEAVMVVALVAAAMGGMVITAVPIDLPEFHRYKILTRARMKVSVTQPAILRRWRLASKGRAIIPVPPSRFAPSVGTFCGGWMYVAVCGACRSIVGALLE